jgi:intracellular multiplication protein IcmK
VVWLASRALDGPESGLKDPEDAKDRLPASEKKPSSKKRKEAMASSNLTEGRPKSLAGRSAPSADESIALSHFGAGEELPRAKAIQISSAAAANSPASGAPLSSEASQGPPGSSKDAGSKDGGSNEDRRKDEPSGGAREEAETEEIDPEELEAAERQRIYQESLSMLLPASTEEIRGYRKKADEKAKAASDAPIGELLSRTVPIRPEPGEKPPVVSLTPNMVAALIFLDSEGKIWPIASSVLGSGSLFQAETLGESSPGKMIVAPLVNHGTSNLIVTLRDLDMPLVIELTASSALNEGRSVDSLVIFQVGQAGPGSSGGKKGGAPPPPKALDERLYAVMDSMSPKGGRRLKASPALEGEAVYLAGASMYLRTRRSLLWPAPKAKASGPGSLAVYELSPATKLLLTSDGEISELFVPEAKDAGAYESFSGGKEARK